MNLESLPWTIIQARNAEGAVIFRHREFDDSFPRESFPHRLNIFWSSTDPNESGLPTDQESELMRQFEDRLVAAVEPDFHSVLSLVLTGKNQREYVIHTKSTEEFLRRLTEMPQESEPYPIELHHTLDAEWEYVDRVLGDIDYEEKTAQPGATDNPDDVQRLREDH